MLTPLRWKGRGLAVRLTPKQSIHFQLHNKHIGTNIREEFIRYIDKNCGQLYTLYKLREGSKKKYSLLGGPGY